ncbi:hypothetical protein UlMin_022285 [Ulmus minor]
MSRRTSQVFVSMNLMTTTQIFKESIRIILLHPTHFNSLSIFLFSPLPISLFLSHFLIHHFPKITSSTISLAHNFFGYSMPIFLSKISIQMILCFPSFITFSLLGRAATVQAVSDIYRGVYLDGRRLFLRSGLSWIKLLYTTFWEFLIVLGLIGVLVASLAILPKMVEKCGVTSEMLGFGGVLVFLGIPLCVIFAHVMVVGNLARVIAVLESECCGFESLLKAKTLMEGKRQTALIMALLSNVGFRMVECVFEFRMCRGINLWEVPLLVSMYSLVLVFDTVMNVVFYYACKSLND